jgi:hypothetical protein
MLNFESLPGDLHGDMVPPAPNAEGVPISYGGLTSALLETGNSLWSPSNAFRLMFQPDENVVVQVLTNPPPRTWLEGIPFEPPVYTAWTPLWATGTNGTSVNQVAMQSDGNLVAYAGTVAKWDSGTNGNSGAFLRMQDDGNLVIYSIPAPLYGHPEPTPKPICDDCTTVRYGPERRRPRARFRRGDRRTETSYLGPGSSSVNDSVRLQLPRVLRLLRLICCTASRSPHRRSAAS